MSMYTQKTEKQAKKYKLTVEEYYFIKLYASGENVDDAWNATVERGLSWTKAARKEEIDKILDSEGAHMLMYELGNENKDSIDGNSSIDYTDKDQILEEMTRQARSATSPKDKASILAKIADLQMMKHDEVKTEDSTIHYYLPLSCNICPLKQKYDKKQG